MDFDPFSETGYWMQLACSYQSPGVGQNMWSLNCPWEDGYSSSCLLELPKALFVSCKIVIQLYLYLRESGIYCKNMWDTWHIYIYYIHDIYIYTWHICIYMTYIYIYIHDIYIYNSPHNMWVLFSPIQLWIYPHQTCRYTYPFTIDDILMIWLHFVDDISMMTCDSRQHHFFPLCRSAPKDINLFFQDDCKVYLYFIYIYIYCTYIYCTYIYYTHIYIIHIYYIYIINIHKYIYIYFTYIYILYIYIHITSRFTPFFGFAVIVPSFLRTRLNLTMWRSQAG